MINRKLAEERGLTEEEIEVIEFFHVRRDRMNQDFVHSDFPNHPHNLEAYFIAHVENEKLLQKLWKFPEDLTKIFVRSQVKCKCEMVMSAELLRPVILLRKSCWHYQIKDTVKKYLPHVEVL